jgi:hypothetical protein
MKLPRGHQYRCLFASALLERMDIWEVYTAIFVKRLDL